MLPGTKAKFKTSKESRQALTLDSLEDSLPPAPANAVTTLPSTPLPCDSHAV
jgi:hypothetical protein